MFLMQFINDIRQISGGYSPGNEALDMTKPRKLLGIDRFA